MTKKLEIYKCPHCGNIVEVFVGNGAPIVCCGEKMQLLEEQTADTSKEKHVPFIEEIENGYKVRIGENQAHPMTEKHHIMWIELVADSHIYRKELTPDDEPEATFIIPKTENVFAREYCNIHGLWRKN
ncbi:desulfoferrodoxin [Vallitalea guaymasensis]|uniref:desulfoferrodoxin n=1 Tax=Vallitalea guaymasensis TaxID=1185412 RepID=UPI002729C140|nr:desulfoferrodoxin [Vallitalea guaymasensis]